MKYIVYITICILIILLSLFNNNVENFNIVKKAEKDVKKVKKDVKKVKKDVKKTVKKVKTVVEIPSKIISNSIQKIGKDTYNAITTKQERDFINTQKAEAIKDINKVWKSVTTKEEREMINTFSQKLRSTLELLSSDIKTVSQIMNMFSPLGMAEEAIRQEITTGHIKWDSDFDPCSIISRAIKKYLK